MNFEWDENKAESNLKTHGVSFEEAMDAFFDPNAVRAFDLDHSKEEQRFYLIGFSSRRLLFVIYAEIGEIKDTIRLISARKAERKYQNEYVEANPEE